MLNEILKKFSAPKCKDDIKTCIKLLKRLDKEQILTVSIINNVMQLSSQDKFLRQCDLVSLTMISWYVSSFIKDNQFDQKVFCTFMRKIEQ